MNDISSGSTASPLVAPNGAPLNGAPTPTPPLTVVATPDAHSHDREPTGHYLAVLSLGALGVVYGDIGTSPLYAVKESFSHGVNAADPQAVLGIISLIVWALISLVCIKYLTFVVRADLHREGGILTLAALVGQTKARESKIFPNLLAMGLFGTALLYGDGMITPAISVLSAVEGLSVATKVFDPYIVPITIGLLVGLFMAQSHGTAAVGRVFGFVMLIWFSSLGILGLTQVLHRPDVLLALSPLPGYHFLMAHGIGSFAVLGSVFLVVTGGEALYADMGHFGRRPIRLAWFSLTFPALVLCYLGQGALILQDPTSIDNPFFRLVPGSLLYLMVILATAATVIASQALISGAFSLTLQAVQLGYVPRLRVDHTSATEKGQVYVPAVNWFLMLACIGLVLAFRTSSNLAAAYGIAVTGTMLITTMLFYVLVRNGWSWGKLKALSLCGSFAAIEGIFFAGNIIKIPNGGWFPIVVGVAVFMLMSTWKTGRQMVAQVLWSQTVPVQQLLDNLASRGRGVLDRRAEREAAPGAPERRVSSQPQLSCASLARVSGTAVFMYGNRKGTPPAMLSNLRHNKVLHERVVLVAVEISDRPFLDPARVVEVAPLGQGFYRAFVKFGYLDKPDVSSALLSASCEDGKPLITNDTTYFLGKETLLPSRVEATRMTPWREKLFAFMSRNAQDATAFFALPPEQVVELGVQVEI